MFNLRKQGADTWTTPDTPHCPSARVGTEICYEARSSAFNFNTPPPSCTGVYSITAKRDPVPRLATCRINCSYRSIYLNSVTSRSTGISHPLRAAQHRTASHQHHIPYHAPLFHFSTHNSSALEPSIRPPPITFSIVAAPSVPSTSPTDILLPTSSLTYSYQSILFSSVTLLWNPPSH